MRPYVVQEGDHLKKLAHRLGFDPDKVWNDPANAELKKKRDPNLLHPGDVLQVPEKDDRRLPFSVGTTNTFTVRVPRVKVRLAFADEHGPIANEAYTVSGFAAPAGQTDGDGGLTLSVPVNVREVVVLFPKRNLFHRVRVGDMDPVEESSGVDKRLQHLGYMAPPPYVNVELQRAAALRAFQRASGLPETGEIDQATRDALVKANGS